MDGELTLSAPFLGCSPRPLNKPGGSTLKLPTFSLRPSSEQVTYFASISSFCFFSSFFSAEVRAFFLAFSSSKYSNIGRKSQRSNSLMIVPLRYYLDQRGGMSDGMMIHTAGYFFSTLDQSSKKFLLKVASFAWSVSSMAP